MIPYKFIPDNDKYAIDIKPVNIIVMPIPLKPWGTFEYFNLNLIAAIEIIATPHPIPELIPKTNYSLSV